LGVAHNRKRIDFGKYHTFKAAHLLRRFWSLNCIAWPTYRWSGLLLVPHPANALGWGSQQNLVRFIEELIPKNKSNNPFRLMCFLLLSINNIEEAGDLAPDVVDIANYQESPRWRALLRLWARFLNVKYKPTKHITYLDFGVKPLYRVVSHTDDNFSWIIEKSEDMRLWADEAAAFVKVQKANKKGAIHFVNKLFNYLLITPESARNPVEYLRNTYPKVLRFDYLQLDISEESKIAANNKISEFMDFILHRHCTEPDDTGHLYLRMGFANPHKRVVTNNSSTGETTRQVMPTHLLKSAMSIITENIVRDENGNPLLDENGQIVREEFAWAKGAMKRISGFGDFFSYVDPVTFKETSMWSPVRVAILMLKLLIPPRTFQIRVQESDEQDTEILGPDGWIPNDHPLAPQRSRDPQNRVERGALRRFTRRDGSIGTHIFFNTNKTADLGIAPSKRGYVMPWERQEAIDIYRFINNWQRKFNAVRSPTKWADIEELRKRVHLDELALMGSATFLFRDPVDGRGTPISDSKVRTLWAYVLDELEKRLYRSGERLSDGSPIRLILTRFGSGQPCMVLYDLHTLRVTLISLLYEENVPIEIIMKIVGHASILMTLYYTKIHHEDISAKCDAAIAKAAQNEQAQWVHHIAQLSREELQPLVAYVYEDGLTAITKSSGHYIVTMPHGICPVGKARCQVGLSNPEKEDKDSSYGPVPGLSRNCPRCRFFVSGVNFFEGLTACLNEKSYILREESQKYEAAQNKFDNLQDNVAREMELGRPIPESNLRDRDAAQRQYENLLVNVNEAARNFSAAYTLHSQLEAILNRRAKEDSDGYALVAVGGWEHLRAEFREVHEFQLFDRICRQAETYDGLQIDWSKPNLQRLRYFNRILLDSGLETHFDLVLSEPQCLQIGNELGRFLYDKLGEDGVAALVERKTTLRSLGLEKEFEVKLSSLQPIKISFLKTPRLNNVHND
jgi:hypothetical protein